MSDRPAAAPRTRAEVESEQAHQALQRGQDLLGAGDPAAAAIALAGDAKAVARNPAALDLLAFALSERYPPLKRAARELGA